MAKHLVLDDDVHRKLRAKKKETGLNVKDIGNAVLRCLLDRPLVSELIGKRLIESGRLTEEEFEQIQRDAFREASTPSAEIDALVRPTQHATLAVGSWEMREICRTSDGSVQVLSGWAKDRRSRPFPTHVHDADEFFVVHAGRVLVALEGEPVILAAPSSYHVPRGLSHSVTPLEAGSHMLVILSPPEEAYATQNE